MMSEMTHPTDDELEAMAVRLYTCNDWETDAQIKLAGGAAAMLRACKTGDAPDHAEWQPIETCPKTPTARLVWVPENQCIYCVAWKEDREYPWSGAWSIFGGGHRDAIQRATHWMPLPAFTPPERPKP
jgi:hypothetical protein